MRRKVYLLAAAAISAGGMCFVSSPSAWAQNTDTTAAQQTENAADRTGNAMDRTAERTGAAIDRAAEGQGLRGTAQAPDAEGIRDVIASSTEAAFTRGGFDDLVERFVDADRNRFGKAMPDDAALDASNAQIAQFLDAWKAKYNQDFDIDNEDQVFARLQIQQGETGSAARMAGERITGEPGASARVDTPAGDASGSVKVDRDASDRVGDVAANVDSPGSPEADANRNDPGRNIATVTVPADSGLAQLQVPMIHEFPDAWRIDVPDTVDAAKLHANLTQHTQQLLAQKDQWPSDANQAYLLVSHHVLAAIFDSAGTGSDAAGTGATGTGAGGMNYR